MDSAAAYLDELVARLRAVLDIELVGVYAGGSYALGDYEPARHWFAIDRSILAGHGIALFGPPAEDVFVPPARSELLPLVAETLRWYLREGPGDESAVLNACRAVHFAREGVWVAKRAVRAAAGKALAESGDAKELLRLAVAELDARASGAA